MRCVRNLHGLLPFDWNVSKEGATWSALRWGACGETGRKLPQLPIDYMLQNAFPCGRRSAMWPPFSLRRNLSAATCRPCDRFMLLAWPNCWTENRVPGDCQRLIIYVTSVPWIIWLSSEYRQRGENSFWDNIRIFIQGTICFSACVSPAFHAHLQVSRSTMSLTPGHHQLKMKEIRHNKYVIPGQNIKMPCIYKETRLHIF